MTDVELYLTFISISSLLLAFWGFMQSWKMRSQALDERMAFAEDNLAHAEVTAKNAESITKHSKAINEDRAAMDLIAKRLQEHDRKLDALLRLVMKQQNGGQQ